MVDNHPSHVRGGDDDEQVHDDQDIMIETDRSQHKHKSQRRRRPSPLKTINWQKKLHNILEVPNSSIISKILTIVVCLLIVISVVCLCLSTVEHFRGQLYWLIIEGVIAAVFTVEYFVRLVVATLNFDASQHRIVAKEWYKQLFFFVVSGWSVVDLLAFVPYWINLALFGLTEGTSIEHIGIVRIVRLVRLFKFWNFGVRVHLLMKAIRLNLAMLLSVSALSACAVIVFSSLIYFAETTQQPDVFSSIPATFWFCIIALSTTGFGDMVPVTFQGKLFASFTLMTGILTIALPSMIVGTEYTRLVKLLKYKHRIEQVSTPKDKVNNPKVIMANLEHHIRKLQQQNAKLMEYMKVNEEAAVQMQAAMVLLKQANVQALDTQDDDMAESDLIATMSSSSPNQAYTLLVQSPVDTPTKHHRSTSFDISMQTPSFHDEDIFHLNRRFSSEI